MNCREVQRPLDRLTPLGMASGSHGIFQESGNFSERTRSRVRA